MKATPEHKDVTGKVIKLGDTVAFAKGGHCALHVGEVVTLLPKTVRVACTTRHKHYMSGEIVEQTNEYVRHPLDTVVVAL
ncbi:hypothetical protein 10RS306A_gene4592 [Ralstonia phage 10RS306A]|uniref:Uncharacterized protein n=1 Tax=Ralstonia phage 10RS306A TaxID=2968818 RepID=A0A977TEP8_9CAUD|nr:hypothetical protein 10RS306A_gene4592 [Ralstonia phage 10RS306A]